MGQSQGTEAEIMRYNTVDSWKEWADKYELKDSPRIQTAIDILNDAKIFVNKMKEIVL